MASASVLFVVVFLVFVGGWVVPRPLFCTCLGGGAAAPLFFFPAPTPFPFTANPFLFPAFIVLILSPTPGPFAANTFLLFPVFTVLTFFVGMEQGLRVQNRIKTHVHMTVGFERAMA